MAVLAPRSATAQRLQTEWLTESDGLPSSMIRGLAQDVNGRLWVLTRGGLASYDGRHIEAHAEVAGVATRDLMVLSRDQRGAIWAASSDLPPKLVHFDGEQWTAVRSARETPWPQGEQLTSIAVSLGRNADQVVVGTTLGFYLLRAGQWITLGLDEGFTPEPVQALEAYGEEIFVAGPGGLCILHAGTVDCSLGEISPRLSEPIRALSIERSEPEDDRLWMVGTDWIGVLNLASRRLEVVRSGLLIPSSEGGAVIGVDAQDGVFFGSTSHAWLLDRLQGDQLWLGPESGLTGGGLTAFLLDRESNVWLGSLRGLNRIASRRFLSYGIGQGLLEDEVTAIAEIAPGSLLLGHNLGLTLLEPEAVHTIPIPHVQGEPGTESRVMQIAVGPGGEVVIAAVSRGVGRLLPSRELVWNGAGEGLPEKVYSVQFDPTGRLLVAAGTQGAWVREDGRFSQLDLGGYWPSYVRRVVVLPSGAVYLATTEGVFWSDGGEWRQAFAPQGEKGANDVFDVLQDRSGRVLVGTMVGLFRVDGDRLVAQELGESTLERPIYQLLEDRAGTLWLGTDNGAFLWDGDHLRHRTVTHGLAGRETNRCASLVDSQGRVWIGTESGVSVYRARLDDNRAMVPPIAEISAIEVGNQQYPVDQRIELEPGDNDLFFRVAGVSLNHDSQLLMKYFLEGYDEEWLGPQPLTSAPIRYTNLHPRSYRFHFRVGRGDGTWSANRRSGSIGVAQPLWQKPWLQGMGLLLLAAVALALYRFDIAKRRAALRDPLTGLPNRVLFTQRLRVALERKGRAGEPGFAVLFLDLDRFKNINDSLGHAAGDELLAEIARRLTGCVQSNDTVSRLGGDEFTVLLDGIRRGEDVGSIAQRLQRAFEAPFRLRGHDVFAGASMGIALGSPRYTLPEEVLRDADTAMYRAKEHGGGRYEFFDPSMHEKAIVLLRLETDLRRALERGELRLYYQPVVRLDSGEQVGCEALLRWQHPERGLLAPQAFLEVAEETGLILPIGEWVLREACAQLAAWRRAGALPKRFTLAVNVSPKQLARPDLAERIAQILRVAGWSGMDLTLEITESSLMSGPDSLKWLLKRCRDIGVSFSIDDFGTGHSSLSYLQNFPVQALKIDRSFVARMGTNPASVEIVRTIVDLGRNLGLEVVAEGVETARQAAYLRAIGCNLAQGYLFSGPIPAASLIQYITVPKAI